MVLHLRHNLLGNAPRGHNLERPHSFEAKRNREFASEPVGGSATIARGFRAAGCPQRDRPLPDSDGGLHPSARFGGLGATLIGHPTFTGAIAQAFGCVGDRQVAVAYSPQLSLLRIVRLGCRI